MPLLGQASGGWTESSSALRLLHVGVRNTVGVLTDDAFTQANPVGYALQPSTQIDVTATGVLSGSVAFTRPDGGENFLGGPGTAAVKAALIAANQDNRYQELGCFINSANGNAYENTPGAASGKGPYVSGNGTYGNSVYETLGQERSVGGGAAPFAAAGGALTYAVGLRLISSVNGFLMPVDQQSAAGNIVSMDETNVTTNGGGARSVVLNTANSSTILGVLKMAPDATQNELVYDQRI